VPGICTRYPARPAVPAARRRRAVVVAWRGAGTGATRDPPAGRVGRGQAPRAHGFLTSSATSRTYGRRRMSIRHDAPRWSRAGELRCACSSDRASLPGHPMWAYRGRHLAAPAEGDDRGVDWSGATG
jgi:hypothetical protein